jgi:site-specific DNA recombinase
MGASYTAVEGIGAELGSPPVVRAAICCRRSRRGGRSVERQEQDGRQIAAEKGWEVVAVYREGASASPYVKKSRKEWDALLAAVEAGQLDAVIVWMEDRTARDVVQAGAFVGERGRRRVEDVDGTSRTVPAVSEEQAEAERELIREAARRILAGDSLRGICLDWNEAGYASPRGARWTTQTLRRMLLSPRLAGLREHHGKLYQGNFPAILEPETWQAVRVILGPSCEPPGTGTTGWSTTVARRGRMAAEIVSHARHLT